MQEGVRAKKGSIRNNDICDELIISNQEMRFDPKERERQARQAENDALMREAEAALAQTETVLKTRKDALVQKHVEGRESLHELDYIFSDPKFDL